MRRGLGWDDAAFEREVEHSLRRVEAERQSQRMETDQEADQARIRSRDVLGA